VGLRVVIVQHGDKERLPGDPGLTALGREQATLVAERLRPIDAPIGVWTSPMRRARETAKPIVQALGVPLATDARLRERMNWSGPDAETIEAFLEDWRAATTDRSHEPRSGDSSHAAAARFLAVLDELATAHDEGTAIVVAHGGVTTDALRDLLGDEELRSRHPTVVEDGVPSGALTTLTAIEGGWQVDAIAVTSHLDAASGHH